MPLPLWFLHIHIHTLSAMMRMAGSIAKSTEVMKAMQNLIKVPEIQASMMELSKEMSKVSVH